MEIPLNNPQTPDIYEFGFDKTLNRKYETPRNPFVYDVINDQIIPTLNSGGALLIGSDGKIQQTNTMIPALVMMDTPVVLVNTSTEAADATSATSFTTVDISSHVNTNTKGDVARFALLQTYITVQWNPAVSSAEMVGCFRPFGSTLTRANSIPNITVGAGSANPEAGTQTIIIDLDSAQRFQHNLRRNNTGTAPSALTFQVVLVGYLK